MVRTVHIKNITAAHTGAMVRNQNTEGTDRSQAAHARAMVGKQKGGNWQGADRSCTVLAR